MNSREEILGRIQQVRIPPRPLPVVYGNSLFEPDIETFRQTLENIGGKCFILKDMDEVMPLAVSLFPDAQVVVSGLAQMNQYTLPRTSDQKPHMLENAGLVVLEARLAVSENGAVWLTEADMIVRVLPFIGEHLVVVVRSSDLVATMHDAYRKIGEGDHGFGVFISGPSKTADIEQSLVMGAHGPRTMTVMLVDQS